MSKGYLAIILHAHLPFVKHEKDGELAEDWLYEAITETYIPLIIMMNRLWEKGAEFHFTLNISPTLASMLANPTLQYRYQKHLEKMIELSEKELIRTKNQPEFYKLAEMYNYLFKEAYYYFHEKYDNNLLSAYKEFQEKDLIEIITCAATHGYLPLMLTEEAMNAQVKIGVNTYQKFFDKRPEGIWLPECAFTPSLDPILADNDIRYYISSSHGVLYAEPRPRYGLFAPIYTPSGLAAFGRDVESSKQVWSANEGYPGDFNYREFYRDIGWDLDYDYLKDYLPSGIRKHTGLKYYKITGKSDWKDVYDPVLAREKAAEHAGNFMFNRQEQLKHLNELMDRKPIIVSPYDAELYGHWWFEGPQWLEFLFEKIHFDQDVIETITLSEYLKRHPKNQVAMPTESSWGYRGYHEVWLNDTNDWIYRHLHQAELKMIELAEQFDYLSSRSDIYYRTLNQMARELLLAQSSDWAFIMKADTMVDYAVLRTKRHLKNFSTLEEQINRRNIIQEDLKRLESVHDLFPEIDFKLYNKKEEVALRKEV
ncbi:glycoside hydrolase family 57 protein [Natronospora cellulosivora (SeqCode)]